jgi:NAD(P)-dependent dehydrogenase (short-subunit alcohol dehydrogenase family)
MGRFAGRRVIIVGGSTGIGLAGARRIVSEGGEVLLIGRNQESLEKAVGELGSGARLFVGDACDSSVVVEAIKQLEGNGGSLSGLFHVAGGSGRKMGDGPLHELSDQGLDFTLDLNLKSVIYSNRAAVRAFRKQGTGGAILNTGSVLGFSPSPRYFSTHAYAAAKSAIIGFTQSIASYYAAEGIRANVISPALVETPMAERACGDSEILDFIRTKQPLEGGRPGFPADLEGAIALLLSEDGRYITGQNLAVDGGWTVSEGQANDGGTFPG